MTNKEILKKLKLINQINPDQRWVSKNRSDLLLQIKEDRSVSHEKTWSKITGWLELNFGFLLNIMIPHRFIDAFGRPVIISLVGAMILVSTMSTIGMAQNTMPGDILYPIKIVGENIQLSLTPTVEGKARIEMEFAGRRIEELNKLAAANKLSVSKFEEKVKKITDKLEKNINTVNIHLARLDESGKAEDVLKVAKDIDKRVIEYTVALNKINKISPSKVKITEALTRVEEVSDKALEVIVTKHKDVKNGISDVEIADKLNNKIVMATIETGISDNAEIQNEEVSQAFQDARDLIEVGDFAAALSKITEGKDIIKELRAKMESEEEITEDNTESGTTEEEKENSDSEDNDNEGDITKEEEENTEVLDVSNNENEDDENKKDEDIEPEEEIEIKNVEDGEDKLNIDN